MLSRESYIYPARTYLVITYLILNDRKLSTYNT
jgi:hypothetical protein